MIVITGAEVVTPEGLTRTDVAVSGASISQVGPITPGPGDEVIDGRGRILGPGLVDIHVHFRDPCARSKEDLASGSRSAAAGGFTAVVVMPNTDPAIDSARAVDDILLRSRGLPVEIGVAGSLTIGRKGKAMARLEEMYQSGVRLFTDDGDTVADAGLLRSIMLYFADRPDVVVAQHAEDPSIAGNGHLHAGEIAERLGIEGLPSTAEEIVIARDILLARETGVAYHAQHLSTSGSVELIRQAKSAGLAVTAEVTPHHLTLTERDAAGLDTNHKMYPPLRTEGDREGLVSGLIDGTIDAVATDHAPHTEEEKDAPFEEAPRGVIGLETAVPLTLAALGGDVATLFERMSSAPARIAGLHRQGKAIAPGSPANLTLVDPTASWVPETFESKSTNTPFRAVEMKGRVVTTISEGKITHEAAL